MVEADGGPVILFLVVPLILTFNLYSDIIFLYKQWELKIHFQFEIILTVLDISFRFFGIPMLWVYHHYTYFNSFSAGTDVRRQNLQMSDSDV